MTKPIFTKLFVNQEVATNLLPCKKSKESFLTCKKLCVFILFFILPYALSSASQDWREQYDEVGLFENGVAYVSKNKLYGYVNTNGTEVIPCVYTAIGSFNKQGVVWVNKGGTLGSANGGISGGSFGVYDRKGNVILPVKYKQLGYFDSNRSSDGNPYCKFRSIAGLNYGDSRYNADVENRTLMKSKGLVWVAKNSGNFDIHEPIPFVAIPFYPLEMNGYNCFAFSNSTKNPTPGQLNGKLVYIDETSRGSNKWGIVDISGKILLPVDLYDFCYNPSDGFVPIVHIEKTIYTINYYNIEKNALQFPEFMRTLAVAPVINGKAMIVDDKGCQFMDMDGQRQGPLYDAVIPSIDADVYTVFKDMKFGVIDHNGKIVIPLNYQLISAAQEGMMSYADKGEDGKSYYGYMTQEGDILLKPQFSSVFHFENGMALVRQGDKYGYIDKLGRFIFPCNFAKIFPASNPEQNIFFVQEVKDGPVYAYQAFSDQRLFDVSFKNVRNFGRDYPNVAFVTQESANKKFEFFGCVSSTGEMLIPCKCLSYEEAMRIYFNRTRDGFLLWTEQDSRRFEKQHDPKRNSFNIYEKIDESAWDY